MGPNFLALAKLKLLSFEHGKAQQVKTPCKLDSSRSFKLVKIKIDYACFELFGKAY